MPTGTAADTVCRDCGNLLPRDVAEAADYLYGGYREDVFRLEQSIADLIGEPGQTRTDEEIGAYAIQNWIGHDTADLVAAVRHAMKDHA